jgi:hypothetical protein
MLPYRGRGAAHAFAPHSCTNIHPGNIAMSHTITTTSNKTNEFFMQDTALTGKSSPKSEKHHDGVSISARL